MIPPRFCRSFLMQTFADTFPGKQTHTAFGPWVEETNGNMARIDDTNGDISPGLQTQTARSRQNGQI